MGANVPESKKGVSGESGVREIFAVFGKQLSGRTGEPDTKLNNYRQNFACFCRQILR